VDQVAWTEQLVLIPFIVAGVGVGLWLLSAVPTSVLARLPGCFVIAYAIYQMLPLPELRGSRTATSYCGLLGGLVGTLFGTGGPFHVIYLNLRGLDRTVFRATFAMNFLIDGGVRLAAFAAAGLYHRQTVGYLLAAVPIAGAGLYRGADAMARQLGRALPALPGSPRSGRASPTATRSRPTSRTRS
jgi:uncharacterized membrane protein YfcA